MGLDDSQSYVFDNRNAWSALWLRYTTPQPGTERFAIGEAFNPHRVMINLDGTGRDMNYDGWRHKTHFYAYPNQKSHVAAIGQAQSNLWGLPHLSGLLERAFWSWAIYARNSRVVSQAEYRETALQAVEIEIAQQKSALNRLQSQEKKHEATLQQDTSEWHRTIEDTEDLLYQSCMQKTSNAKGFTKEMHEIRNQSTEHKIVGAKLRADMDALLRQQRARKAKSDAVLAERAKQRTRDAERKQQEFLEGEARKREEQRVKDSHRLEKIVAQGKGELEKFLNDTESAEAKAEAKAEAEAAGDVEANAELAPGAATTEGDTAQRQSFLIPEPPKDSGDPTSRGSRWNRAQRLFQGGLMSSPAAVDAFRRADALREARQWEGAADAYASAIRLRHAATATALNQRGVCLAEVPGRLDEAVAEYSRALELTPHLAPIWHNRGVARMTQGNLTAAAVDLQRALELAHNDDTVQLLEEVKAELASPEDAREAMREALGAYSQENYLLALSQFERALELGEVRRSRCFNGVGLCYLAENQRDLALEAFQKALEADPDNASAKHNVDVLQRG
jgi:tetratricopeptide (TPR) repeat protein